MGKAATSLSGVHGAVRAKVDSLYPTSLLSAVVVTNPWHGFEAGDFVAETYAEVMALPKTQLDQRMFTKERVQALVEHTPVFPNDGLVLDKAAAEKEWQRFRKYTVDRIDKTAWPLAQHGARIKFLHGGRQLVVPDKVAQAAAAARAP
ncbi:hypothetical protein EON62_00530 [archaeon]|nr:MAG: hypothetical protein EON62_00530 [archaeon]